MKFQNFKWLAMCDVWRRVDKEEIYKLIFLVPKMFQIFKLFIRNSVHYNFIPYSGEKTVEIHISPVFSSRMKIIICSLCSRSDIYKLKGMFSDGSVYMFQVIHWCDIIVTKLCAHKWNEKYMIWFVMLECVQSQQERRQIWCKTVNDRKKKQL
jgi:hypothetical protein